MDTYLEAATARDVLWMYRAFGLLKMRYVVFNKRRGYTSRFDEANLLVPYIRDVLAALDRAMPQWRMREERQRTGPMPKRWDPASRSAQDRALEVVTINPHRR